MIETIKASKIGMGEGTGRKTLGRMYVGYHAKSLHRNIACSWIDPTEVMSVPVFEEDGEIRFIRGEWTPIGKICEWCNYTLDRDWIDQAACNGDDRAFTTSQKERAAFIKERCDNCPVVLECLEYGAHDQESNVSGVWGGVYFYPTNPVERKKRIEQRRRELTHGVSPQPEEARREAH